MSVDPTPVDHDHLWCTTTEAYHLHQPLLAEQLGLLTETSATNPAAIPAALRGPNWTPED
ncbi:hypothetical protein ACIBJC_15335 [Streptomyces sp. NPDC050509]|uniref:hypothetical protein n=1 Tax=Streptomyces sp. NPDC050509 TaxID=3365620 RepID=UPI003798A43B